jgi:hypothetical protein
MVHETLVFLRGEWTLAVMIPVPLERRQRKWLPYGLAQQDRFCDSTPAEEAAYAAQELKIRKHCFRSSRASPSIGELFLVGIRPVSTNGI